MPAYYWSYAIDDQSPQDKSYSTLGFWWKVPTEAATSQVQNLHKPMNMFIMSA